MSENSIITQLTPEQEVLIPVYQEKWRKIALSTKPIDKQKVADAVKGAYKWFGEKEPEIIFFDSPYAAFYNIHEVPRYELPEEDLLRKIRHPLINDQRIPIDAYIMHRVIDKSAKDSQLMLDENLCSRLNEELELSIVDYGEQKYYQIYAEVEEKLDEEGEHIPHDFCNGTIQLDLIIPECAYYDFLITVLNYPHDSNQWQALYGIVCNCGWILPLLDYCIVCNRPNKLSFDSRKQLHAKGEAAIEFRDGFKVYAYHGVRLPQKYGEVHTNEWKAQWLLEERNAELRRVLIQGIGYERICQELGAIELDSLQEYTLLKIDNYTELNRRGSVLQESMCLLKMTCPSTGHVHILRVPPDITSARAAICWINWDIEPEDFAVQS